MVGGRIDGPVDVQAERRLVGGLLCGGSWWDASAHLSPAELTDRDCRSVCEVVRGLADDDVTVTPQSVHDRLASSNGSGSPAGVIHDLMTVGQASRIPQLAARLSGLARRRRIISTVRDLAVAASDPNVAVEASVEQTVAALLSSATGTSGILDADTLTSDTLDLIADPTPPGVSTGWRDVDGCVQAVPGTLWVVTGSPGSGKSTWVDCLTVNLAAGHGWQTVMFAPESGPADVHCRELVHTRMGRQPGAGSMLDDGDVEGQVRWVCRHVRWLDDRQVNTVDGILARTRAIVARWDGPTMLTIDPWNHVVHDRAPGEREDQYITRQLGRLSRFARQTSTQVVVVAHPTKLAKVAGTSNVHEVPSAYDIAGGAAWYNAADFIVCVWRDKTAERRPAEFVDVHVQKVRREGWWGHVGRVQLRFDAATRTYGPTTPQTPY